MINMLHGCARDWHSGKQSCRNFVPIDALWTHLRDSRTRYEPLVAHERHDVLTVDDSTRGAALVCAMAREAGHHVTLFVNPAPIETGRDYWFTRFDAALDGRRVDRASFDGNTYRLGGWAEVRRFRLAVKQALLAAPRDQTETILAAVIADLVPDGCIDIPDHAAIVTAAELAELHAAGASIENHGWDHDEIAMLDVTAVQSHVATGAAWIDGKIGQSVGHYATPFGMTRLPDAVPDVLSSLVVLANPLLPLGPLDGRHVNRNDLTPALRTQI